MNNVDDINNIKRLLEQVPAKLVETYERKALKGKSLRAMVDEHDLLSRKEKRLMRILTLLPYVFFIGIIGGSVAFVYDYLTFGSLVLIISFVAPLWLLTANTNQRLIISRKLDILSAVFVVFNKTVCDMKPLGDKPYGNSGHLAFEPRFVLAGLIGLARGILASEKLFENARLNLKVSFEHVVAAANEVESWRGRFEVMWNAVGLFEAVKPEEYDKERIFANARKLLTGTRANRTERLDEDELPPDGPVRDLEPGC